MKQPHYTMTEVKVVETAGYMRYIIISFHLTDHGEPIYLSGEETPC